MPRVCIVKGTGKGTVIHAQTEVNTAVRAICTVLYMADFFIYLHPFQVRSLPFLSVSGFCCVSQVAVRYVQTICIQSAPCW